MKFGFIGCGNMAQAIISGMLKNQTCNSKDIYAFDLNNGLLNDANGKFNINITNDNIELTKSVDCIIVAVKPNVQEIVFKEIINYIDNKLIISIAAGKSIDFISKNLNSNAKIIRIMPNFNAMINQAMSAYIGNEKVTDNDYEIAKLITSSIGEGILLEEKYFPLFGVISGCAPAMIYLLAESIAHTSVKHGMNKSTALQIACKVISGSAEMISKSDEHPWQLIDKVCSPGGTTIEMISTLQSEGFESIIEDSIDAAIEKDSKL